MSTDIAAAMKILIVDDEPLARERLSAMVQTIADAQIVGEAANGKQAFDQIVELKPDVVLLDISMPELDGLQLARILVETENPAAIIFCTAFDEHALAAFDANAVDYLLKPIRQERLQTALKKARRFTREDLNQVVQNFPDSGQRTHICARVRGSLKLVATEQVLYFLAEDKYVSVHHSDGEVLIEDSLKSLEDEFTEGFVRIHRNCLVAVSRIIGMNKHNDGRIFIKLENCNAELEVSRRNLPAIRKLVKSL